MINQIVGKVFTIYPTDSIPYKETVFKKRRIVLDCSRYDRYTGELYPNFPALEFVGERCKELDRFAPGDIVTISFTLSGRKVEKEGNISFFTNVVGYKIEPYQRQTASPTIEEDDMPF